MISEILNRFNPEIINKVLCRQSYAKDIIEQSKRDLGGYFPLNERISIRRSVTIDDKIGLYLTRNAFEVIKRYFRMKKYTIISHYEYTNEGVTHFYITFYTKTE